MAAPDSLIVERPSSDIVVLKINRPQVRNALNLDVRTRLADEVTRCGADNAVRCVEGFALGGGLELALCADIIIAGEGAKLGLPEVRVGILPGGGGTQKLARLVGRHRAMLLIMTGKMFSAAEALGMGVISELAPSGQALSRALEVANDIAAMPAISIMQIKEIVNAGLNAPLETALMLERKAFQLQFATRDQKEGMRAFMEKRKPKFEGQ